MGTRVGIPGGYQGGLYRYPAHVLEEGPRNSEAGSGSLLQGGWSGWFLGAGRPLHLDHPLQAPGPSGARSAVQACSPGKPRLLANKGEIDLILLKS